MSVLEAGAQRIQARAQAMTPIRSRAQKQRTGPSQAKLAAVTSRTKSITSLTSHGTPCILTRYLGIFTVGLILAHNAVRGADWTIYCIVTFYCPEIITATGIYLQCHKSVIRHCYSSVLTRT